MEASGSSALWHCCSVFCHCLAITIYASKFFNSMTLKIDTVLMIEYRYCDTDFLNINMVALGVIFYHFHMFSEVFWGESI